jgi:hypothetical protein
LPQSSAKKLDVQLLHHFKRIQQPGPPLTISEYKAMNTTMLNKAEINAHQQPLPTEFPVRWSTIK